MTVAGRVSAKALVAAVLLAAFCGRTIAADDAYTDMGYVMQGGGLDHVLCERAAYSAAFDRWFKDYLAGKGVAAESEWAAVLKVAAGVKDLTQLVRLTNSRLAFSDDETSGDRSDLLVCDKTILASTEKAVGPNSPLVASVELFLCGLYEGKNDVPSAILYRKKCLTIHEKLWGPQSARLLVEWRDLARRLIVVKNYKEALQNLDKMISVAQKEKIPIAVKQGLDLKEKIRKLQSKGSKV